MISHSNILVALAIFASVLIPQGSAQEKANPPELPLASAMLVEKFDNYSKQKRAEAEEKIAAKRDEVVAVLEKHLRERTKAGDLDGALAIRSVLEEWRTETEVAQAPRKESAWKALLETGEKPLQGWNFKAGEHIAVNDGVLSIDTVGKKYTPLLYPSGKGNAVIRAEIELELDREIGKPQQAGVGFQLTSKVDGSEMGMLSCVIQAPEANMIYGSIMGDEGDVLAMESHRAGIGKPTVMQIAFVDGHLIVFVRQRKIHDFHDPRLDGAGAALAILLSNNSRVKFEHVEMLVPDAAQVQTLLSGKPIE